MAKKRPLTLAYKRPQRRRRVRRTLADRRESVRYGPDNRLRRSGFGRRKEDQTWDEIDSEF